MDIDRMASRPNLSGSRQDRETLTTSKQDSVVIAIRIRTSRRQTLSGRGEIISQQEVTMETSLSGKKQVGILSVCYTAMSQS